MKTDEFSLQMAVVPQSFLNKIEAGLNKLETILQTKTQEEINSQWIDSSKIPELLGVSRKTWQTYRDNRIIPFSQIGSKIYVKREDLELYLASHYIKAK
jgi:hypothetical protein